jgi:hypothetical protein
MSEAKVGSIYTLMAAILADVSPVSKGRKNVQQGYSFRGIDQVAEMIHPLLAQHGVVMLPRVVEQQRHDYETKSGAVMHAAILTIDWHFVAPDGSEVVARTVGEGADSGDKSTNKAMTAAQKYAITLAFCVPFSDQEEGDAQTPDERQTRRSPRSEPAPRQGAPAKATGPVEHVATEKQTRMLWAKAMSKAEALGVTRQDAEAQLRKIVMDLGYESSRDLPAKHIDSIVNLIDRWTVQTFGETAPPDENF